MAIRITSAFSICSLRIVLLLEKRPMALYHNAALFMSFCLASRVTLVGSGFHHEENGFGHFAHEFAALPAFTLQGQVSFLLTNFQHGGVCGGESRRRHGGPGRTGLLRLP